MADFCGLGSRPDYDFGVSDTNLVRRPGHYCTVTVGLVAHRVNPSFRNSRNSYVPGVFGAVIVHVRVVTPPPTYVHCRYVLFGAEVAANASQSVAPPGPPVNVTVTEPPRATVVMLTVSGGGVTVNVTAFDVPPPGAGVTTVTCEVPATARSAAVILAVNSVGEKYVVVRGDPFH